MVLAITCNCFLTLGAKSECILKENEVLHKDNNDDVNDTDGVNDNDDVNDGDVEQDATSPPKRKKRRLVKVRDYI